MKKELFRVQLPQKIGKNICDKAHRFGYVWDNYLFKAHRFSNFEGDNNPFEPKNPEGEKITFVDTKL